MRRKPGRTALAATSILCSLILAACNCAPTLRYVSVAPASGATIFATAVSTTSGETTTTTITPCTTQQFAATAYYSDGSQKDISSVAGWGSSNTNAATINSAGLASAASAVTAAGDTSIITATAGGASATANLAVDILTSIAVTPTAATVPLGGTQQYAATGNFTVAGGSTTTMDLTTQVAWSVTGGTTSADGSTNSNSVASIGTATGLLTSTSQQNQGTTTVIATMCTVSASTAVTIGPPAAQLLQIYPDSPSIAVGQTADLNARIINTDGSMTFPVPTTVTWASATPAVATIAGNPASPYDGLVTGLTSGTSVITATVGSGTSMLTGTTTVTVSAAAARFAYVANASNSSISEYVVNYSSGTTPAPNGTLTPLGKFSVPNGVQQVVVHPSGNYLYAIGTDAASTITQFTVNPATGAITNTATTTAASTKQASYAVLDPTGSYLYVANPVDGSIVVFSITQGSGALSGAPIQTKTDSGGPAQLFYSSASGGPYLYAVNTGNHTVSGYTVASGQLTAITASGGVFDLAANDSAYVAAGHGAIDPSGSYIYVPDGATNVEGIGVGAGGVLSNLNSTTTAAFAVAGSSATADASVDPTSKYLYVADNSENAIFTLPLTTGAPGAVTGSPASVGQSPVGMAEDSSGAILLVANKLSNTLSSFAVGTGGALPASGSTLETATSPQFPVFYNGTAAASIAPAEVVAANSGSGNLAAFTSGSGGALTADPTNPNYTTFAGNNFVAANSLSDLFITGGTAANQVAAFIATPSNAPSSATLAAVTGSPFSIPAGTAQPTAIAIDASGQYIYAADTKNQTLYGFNYNGSTVSTLFGPILTGVQSIALDPQGTLLYALASGSITAIRYPASASPEVQTPQTGGNFAGNWTAAAIDATGQYLVAFDPTAKAISTFQITPVTGAATDGALTFLNKVSVAGNPASFAFDPAGMYVVVSDSTANTVTAYSFTPKATTVFTPLTGGAIITLPTTPGGSPGQVVFDASGQYLYIALSGVPTGTTPTPGAVAVYTTNVASGVPAFAAVTGSPFAAGTATTGLTTVGVGVVDSVQ